MVELAVAAAGQAEPDPRDAEIARLREALREIADPLTVWQERARAAGHVVPAIHYPRAHNSDVLKAIARRALGIEE